MSVDNDEEQQQRVTERSQILSSEARAPACRRASWKFLESLYSIQNPISYTLNDFVLSQVPFVRHAENVAGLSFSPIFLAYVALSLKRCQCHHFSLSLPYY